MLLTKLIIQLLRTVYLLTHLTAPRRNILYGTFCVDFDWYIFIHGDLQHTV